MYWNPLVLAHSHGILLKVGQLTREITALVCITSLDCYIMCPLLRGAFVSASHVWQTQETNNSLTASCACRRQGNLGNLGSDKETQPVLQTPCKDIIKKLHFKAMIIYS